MSEELTLKILTDAIVSCRKDDAVSAVKKAVEEGIDPADIIEKALSEGVKKVGMLFEEGKMFLPNLILAVDIMQECMDILESETEGSHPDREYGVIINGTVEGDVHDVGKIIVSGMLRASGFTVYDLGSNVALQDFIEKARETNADLISMSALTTISLVRQQELINMLKEQGMRDKFKVMVGGAPASQDWADKIGADCYAKDAAEAVTKVRELLLLK